MQKMQDFFKLMNNTNSGFDCRKNTNNTKFEPIIDETNEISYIKKYYNLFIIRFLKQQQIEQQQIEQIFNNRLQT